MEEVIEELQWSIQAYERQIADQQLNIERDRKSISYAEEQLAKAEKEIWRCELHIAALKEAINRLSKDILRIPDAWASITGIQVMDPDGWRHDMAQSWETPITRDDFIRRASMSTCRAWPSPLLDES